MCTKADKESPPLRNGAIYGCLWGHKQQLRGYSDSFDPEYELAVPALLE
jgi:hypothetical protein